MCTESHRIALSKYKPWVISASKTKPDDHFNLNGDDSNYDPDDDSVDDSGDDSTSSINVNFVQNVFYFRADYENRTPDGEGCIENLVNTIPSSSLERVRSIGIDINTTGTATCVTGSF